MQQAKQVNFNKEALEPVLRGIRITAGAIKATIGPKGRNVFIQRQMTNEMTNDGNKIGMAVNLEDNQENMGAWLVKNTSSETNEEAGDGTSTTAVLLQAIIEEAVKRPENPMDIRSSLQKAGKDVEKWIKESSKDVKANQLKDVATISAESKEIGQMIADLVEKVGPEMPVNIEDNRLPKIEVEVVEGLETKVGYAHNVWVTDREKQAIEYNEEVPVFATSRKISSLPDIQVFLKKMQEAGLNTYLLLTSDIDDNILGAFVNSKILGQANGIVIKVRGSELEDMAASVGATLISETSGTKFSDFKLDHLGKAKKLFITDKKTVLVGEPSIIRNSFISELEGKAANTKNKMEAEGYLRRAYALKGGVALVKVGANTDTERGYLKDKIEDTINACKSAMEEGLVEGGGMCLYRISNKLKGNSVGEEILKKALTAPLRAIIENAGKDYTKIVKKISSKKGYDASKDKNVDMFKEGIVDPAKVTRCAFKNALSNASTFITTEVVISDLPEKYAGK